MVRRLLEPSAAPFLLCALLLQAIPAWSQCNCNDADGDGFPEANATCAGTSITFPKERWEDAQGQDVTFSFSCGGGPCACGQYVTGDYWVVDPDDGSADLAISSVSPAPVLVANHGWQHGWTVNPNPVSTYGDIGSVAALRFLCDDFDAATVCARLRRRPIRRTRPASRRRSRCRPRRRRR